MVRLFLAVLLAFVSSGASAIVRYMVQGMSCVEMQEALDRDGRAIFYRHGRSGITLYDRFVKDESFCPAGYIATKQRIEAADTDDCSVTKCIEARRFGG